MTNSTITRALLALLAACFVVAGFSNDAYADKPKHVLKIATLAPKNSSWMNSFERTNREIRKATNGEVVMKIYAGGVMGDESAMVRKMRTGQLDGGAVTSVGMGDIAPELLVLQLPLTFRNYKELDYVRDQMTETFRKLLADKGFVLLHWGDVGFNYVFSNSPIAAPADFKKVKPWVWDADPVSKALMEVSGVNATPLGVPDVLPSLSTGVIDTFSNSPYGAVALQWHTEATHVTNLRLAVVIGGLIVSKKSWEQLPKEHQEAIRKIANKNGKALLKQIRKDNKNAIKTIQSAGIKMVKPTDMKNWMEMSEKTKKALTGKLFSKALVDEMEKHLKAYRK
jgi:TRAP-type C4-dicarboxylate transport system substrate-binding protein